jgi:hypothetical protein
VTLRTPARYGTYLAGRCRRFVEAGTLVAMPIEHEEDER